MPLSYPDDVDGEVLRRIADAGSDMSKPMLIDFQISVSDEASANAIAQAAAKLGYQTKIYRHEVDDPWTTECSKEMLATHDGVISAQAELDALSKPFGGFSDGWGTFGNVDVP